MKQDLDYGDLEIFRWKWGDPIPDYIQIVQPPVEVVNELMRANLKFNQKILEDRLEFLHNIEKIMK